MKKIVLIFLLIANIAFAIPDFEKLGWGFSIEAIKGFYPNVKKEFTTGQGVTKYNFYPKNSNIGKTTFYLFQNQLYKIVEEFDPTKVSSGDVQEIFDNFENKYGTSTASIINEEYSDFSIRGNEQTWTSNTTYISFIGEDYFDKNDDIYDTKLMIEYGLIDPKNRKNDSRLNDLILKDKK